VALPAVFAGAPQGHTLIQDDVISDDSGLADYNAHAMVNKESAANRCARVYFNSRKPTYQLRYKASQQSEPQPVERMSYPVQHDGMQSRVAQQHFEHAGCRGVFAENCVDLFPYRAQHIRFDASTLLSAEVLRCSLTCFWYAEDMPEGYLPILFLLAIAIAFPVIALIVARLLRPSIPNPAKLEAYECGIEAEGSSRGRFTVRFYIVAILFVIFDVETIFLFPWAVRYKQLGWFGVAEVTLFLSILIAGYIWARKKGALDWV